MIEYSSSGSHKDINSISEFSDLVIDAYSSINSQDFELVVSVLQ